MRLKVRYAAATVAVLLTGCGQPRAEPATALGTPAYIRAVGMLQSESRSPSAQARTNAVEALQLSKDPRALDVIEAGLHDEAAGVRFSATLAAGKRKARSLVPTLETLAVSDPIGSVRAGAIYALKRVDRPQHMSDLATLLVAPDAPTRANTAMVLGMLGDPGALPLLESRRSEPDMKARFEITAAMARLGDEPAQKVIVSGVISKFGEDQWNSMVVCADLPPEMSTSPLLTGLLPVPKNVTLDPGEANLTTLRQLLAARSLARQHNGEGREAALANLRNPDPTLRALALLALGEMLTPPQVRGIVGFLDDPEENVKIAAAAAIVNVFVRTEE